jgi:hypothetical protein
MIRMDLTEKDNLRPAFLGGPSASSARWQPRWVEGMPPLEPHCKVPGPRHFDIIHKMLDYRYQIGLLWLLFLYVFLLTADDIMQGVSFDNVTS